MNQGPRTVAAAVVVCYLLLIAVESTPRPLMRGRWIVDYYDLENFFERAQFLPLRAVPYRDVFSEYPPLATLAFTAPMLLVPAARTDVKIYRLVWSTLMGVCLVVLISVVARYRVARGLGPWPALILLTPSPLYFSLMRFDVLCALVTCLSLVFFARRRYGQAYLLLSLGSFLKWYPAVLFPVYVAYHLWTDRRPRDTRWALVYVTATAAIIAISIVAFTWDGMLVPYRFHAARGSQYFNLYWILETRSAPWAPATRRIIEGLFLALQFSIVPVLLIRPIRSMTEFFQYGFFAIYSFVNFCEDRLTAVASVVPSAGTHDCPSAGDVGCIRSSWFCELSRLPRRLRCLFPRRGTGVFVDRVLQRCHLVGGSHSVAARA